MKPAVLFDLGNTLAAYYRADEFGPILKQAIAEVHRELLGRDMTEVTLESALASAARENAEAPDHRFTPMAERFERIFGVSLKRDTDFGYTLCHCFLRPIFAIGRLYDDSVPTLERLRTAGYPIGIVSNAPWGSPPGLWRDELERFGLTRHSDSVVLCGDVGRRKPAPEIFLQAAAAVDRDASHCIFVGDDLRWDIDGSQSVGMRPILIDRDGRHSGYTGERVVDLAGLMQMIGLDG